MGALALTVRIITGDSLPVERLAWAVANGTWKGSRRQLATAIGIHPSSLSPSNFKMTPGVRMHAAALLGVPAGFLAAQPDLPEDLPAPLRSSWEVYQHLRKLAAPEGDGWHEDAAMLRLEAHGLTPAETGMLDRLKRRARTRLATPIAISLPLSEWCDLLDRLIDGTADPGPLPPSVEHFQTQVQRSPLTPDGPMTVASDLSRPPA